MEINRTDCLHRARRLSTVLSFECLVAIELEQVAGQEPLNPYTLKPRDSSSDSQIEAQYRY